MAPIGIDTERGRYTAKKSGMAAVALLVLLAAVPVLADTAQERVISRLSSETSTGVGSLTSPGNEPSQSGTPASLQMRQELEQGSYQEKVIRRLASEPSPRARSTYSEVEEGGQSGTSLQVSQYLEHKQREIRNRLHGE